MGASPQELLLCSLAASATMAIRSCYKEQIEEEGREVQDYQTAFENVLQEKESLMSVEVAGGAGNAHDIIAAEDVRKAIGSTWPLSGDLDWRHSSLDRVAVAVDRISDDENGVQNIHLSVELTGKLNAAQRRFLLSSARELSPIANLLHSNGNGGVVICVDGAAGAGASTSANANVGVGSGSSSAFIPTSSTSRTHTDKGPVTGTGTDKGHVAGF
jgi:hypothetical protein